MAIEPTIIWAKVTGGQAVPLFTPTDATFHQPNTNWTKKLKLNKITAQFVTGTDVSKIGPTLTRCTEERQTVKIINKK